ncbi:phosphodiester glycosidase family protein [Xinfangfangia sp. CPCC 101601]|uniref:Phosphodiester glycosidase family protein n=1 Tax=Pseudogemmobacter lacusdianii TaxID=3069608 RepID=A0ABU0VWW4_9RHOB|nr:phosphodiester glycosidase family protein [Xinfangfangia sp. CPCC 101601]MDQ2066261.1 phosphodiester glycosidase family protein [Xinfangfangia sp. CPCC 101601]
MRALLALLALLMPQAAEAASCRDDQFEGKSFTLCEVQAGEELRLFGAGESGALGSFRAVDEALSAESKRLGFAMNAGMYHRDRSPVGLYIGEGAEAAPLVTRAGPGNFGLLPNGVFCWGGAVTGFAVIESNRFKADPPACRFASQSGPMLVIEGALHPRFLPDSDSENIRNGVGVPKDGGRAVFVMANDPLNFHQFARYFRDHLGLQDALYFDGSISRLYAPELGRHDGGFPMGPIVGTVVPKD